MGGEGCLLFASHQSYISISLMTTKTVTNTGKTQKFFRKVRDERNETIQNISFSENFSHDSYNVFSEPMGTINIRIMKEDFKGNKFMKKISKNLKFV